MPRTLVCVTLADYDRWGERDFVLARIEEAEAALERGDHTYTTAEVRRALAQRRAAKAAPGKAPTPHDDPEKVAKWRARRVDRRRSLRRA